MRLLSQQVKEIICYLGSFRLGEDLIIKLMLVSTFNYVSIYALRKKTRYNRLVFPYRIVSIEPGCVVSKQ